MTVVRERWPLFLLAMACLISLISIGTRAGFGVFLTPVSGDLGWGREVFALAIALQQLVWGVAQPLAGMIADKFGTARTVAAGAVCYAAGLYLMAGTEAAWQFHVSAGLLVGLGLGGTGYGIVLSALAKAVSAERRSIIIGIGAAAGSFGQFAMVPLGQALLDAIGWQNAFLALAVIALLMLPAARALRAPPAGVPAGGRQQSLSEAIREAMAHRGYWLLTCGYFVCGFHVAFIAVHFPAYVADRGLSSAHGAWALSIMGLVNILGAFLAGAAGAKFRKKNILSLLYLLRSVAITAMVLLPFSEAGLWIFAVAFGFLWLSTVPLTTALVGDIFGPRYMATLVGFVFFSHQLGSAAGVWVGGWAYDVTGSYDTVWWFAVALGLVAALLHWPIDERRHAPAPA